MTKTSSAPRARFFVSCMAAVSLAALLAACGRGAARAPHALARPAPAATSAASAAGALSAEARLGREIFFDQHLSASGRMACATCHDPAHAYAPADARATALGGPALDRPGLRAVPSLRYVLARTPHWFKQFQANPLERLTETDSVPTGGFTRDGRFDTLHDQARAPLLAGEEMANASEAAVAGKLRQAAYADEFRRVFGAPALADDAQAFAKATLALERFQLEDPSFRPYSSRFDRYLRGEQALSAQEMRGFQAFADPARGNCAACHLVAPGADGSPPLFTDFSFSTLGAPRNPRLAANADPQHFDLGLCGPQRTDQRAQQAWCGMFKTPSLRNVASRGVFLHNGVFTRLEDVVRFYAERDIHPEKWYPRDTRGRIDRYNDLPRALRANIDVLDAPLDRKPGDKPALDDRDVADIVAFLGTLTDADVIPAGAATTTVAAR